jgi:hypothetical protein
VFLEVLLQLPISLDSTSNFHGDMSIFQATTSLQEKALQKPAAVFLQNV